ncbi:MAG: hypothetical protein KOO60_12540 [Gemmatimonadales bacterium]|nr:hypothetical protein [Gemmatimonadales bacterium]
MIASACFNSADGLVPEASRFQSAIFQFPGRPLPLARRLAVYNRVKRILRTFMDEQNFNEVPATAGGVGSYLSGMIDRGFPLVWSECQTDEVSGSPTGGPRREIIAIMGAGLDKDDLLGLQGDLLRTVVEHLSADMLGGRQITRLDRVLTCEHPHLEYGRVREILAERGQPLQPNAVLDPDAETTLTRYCNNQPVMVTGIPFDTASIPTVDMVSGPDTQHLACILPYSGLTITGSVIPGENVRGGLALNLGRLLQFLMGLESVGDTEISPRQRMMTA